MRFGEVLDLSIFSNEVMGFEENNDSLTLAAGVEQGAHQTRRKLCSERRGRLFKLVKGALSCSVLANVWHPPTESLLQ